MLQKTETHTITQRPNTRIFYPNNGQTLKNRKHLAPNHLQMLNFYTTHSHKLGKIKICKHSLGETEGERSDTETPVCRVEMSEFEILQQNATQSDNNSLSLQKY